MSTTRTVTDVPSLIKALRFASGGDIVALKPGTYSNVVLPVVNFDHSQPVTIKSSSTKNLAVLTDLTVGNSSGLNFSFLEFSTKGAPIVGVPPKDVTPFTVQNSAFINFSHLNVHGDSLGTLDNQVSAFLVIDSNYVAITQSTFNYLHNAINHLRVNGFTVTGNSFSYIFDDGVRGGGTSNLVISTNNFSNFHLDPTDTDHTDCIQIWTINTTTSASNITIMNNTYTRGLGGNQTHGIFMRDDYGLVASNMSASVPFRNVLIKGNKLTGANYNGITVVDAIGVTVTNNIVKSYPDAKSWISVINSGGVTATGNQASKFVFTNDINAFIARNTLIPILAGASSTSPSPSVFAQVAAGIGEGGGDIFATENSYAFDDPLSLVVR